MNVRRATLVATALLVALTALTVGAAAPASPRAPAAATFVSPPRQLVQFGYVRSLVRRGARFELRFDPALWLSGITANRAAIQDGAIAPGDTVPNDYYVRNETRRTLVYRVPPTARVTVLTNPGTTGIRSTRITVAELAAIVRGGNPRQRPLYDRMNQLGYWARVATDTVVSLDQQYQP